MRKRSINQKLRLRNFDVRNERIETGAVVTIRTGLSGVERGKAFVISGKKGSVRRETNVVSCMSVVVVRNRHRKPNHPLSHNLQKHKVEVCREKEMPEAEASLRNSIDCSVNTS